MLHDCVALDCLELPVSCHMYCNILTPATPTSRICLDNKLFCTNPNWHACFADIMLDTQREGVYVLVMLDR